VPLPRSTPRRTLIRKFRNLGFEGPRSGKRHPFMQRGKLKVRITNQHEGDIDVSLLSEVLKQAGISEEDWLNA
jgi:hypothetical protein